MTRIYLSPPDPGPDDRQRLLAAMDSGWIAPVGPEIDAFEGELAAATDRLHGVALASGTAALHLALLIGGVGPGDLVLVSSLTFAASANAVRYVGAEPVFVDSDRSSWNLDPDLLAEELEDARRSGQKYAAVIPVDLYGQCADYQRIEALCAEHEVLLIEDAAEALGAFYRDRKAGSFGAMAVLSFNGNKIITTSGGGALLTDRPKWAAEARFLATQARDSAVHYEHSRLGYNYRLSNLLAALGRSQLADLERRVEARRGHNNAYRAALGEIDGIEFMPEAPGCRSTFWLTTLTIDPAASGASRHEVQMHLESLDIEARPVWKPMHLQPLYKACQVIGGEVSGDLFERGLCLPSGSSLTRKQRERVIAGVLEVLRPK
jgi:dTDP-4-amino-4,6-dideoxygalactose transaminase